MADHACIAIDLKSFYASAECIDRKLDPLNTNLVVADESRTEKTICLAVSPALKTFDVPGRPRLFEVIEKVREINILRGRNAPDRILKGKSVYLNELRDNSSLAVDFIVAPPRMARYMELSRQIYQVYLRYIAPEDIHVYSIDEVMIDAGNYLALHGMTARELASAMIRDVYMETGITATAGVGTNLYLCKVAMDILAKHAAPDKNGIRIAELDEAAYRRELWTHRPLTDFWRVGRKTAAKLEAMDIHCMGDLAAFSETDFGEQQLYRTFGVNAELLIDHAWGYEPCTIRDIKNYKPVSNSIGSGQVLSCGYEFDKARIVYTEMLDSLALSLVEKQLLTDQIVIEIGYDIENLSGPNRLRSVNINAVTDRYGRKIPKPAHGSVNLPQKTSSFQVISGMALKLFDDIVDHSLLIRRMYVTANHVSAEGEKVDSVPEQLDLFTDYEALERQRADEQARLEREHSGQLAVLELQKKFGKNAILKGSSLEEGATRIERNGQIGGHKA